MIALTYNDHTKEYNSENQCEPLDVMSFIHTFKYNIDKLYIDKFWSSIDKNDWIVVDYEMLRWIGYVCVRDRDNKKQYLDLIRKMFVEGKDYDISSSRLNIEREVSLAGQNNDIQSREAKGAGQTEFNDKCDLKVTLAATPTIAIGDQDHDVVSSGVNLDRDTTVAPPNTIIVRAKAFKKSLMMIRTSKAEQIRDYFLTLEEIFIDYLKYSNLISEHNRSIEASKLNDSIQVYKSKIEQIESTQTELETLRINEMPVEYNEYVYILTSKRYYNLNLFKIGKTQNLKGRLCSYNTGNVLDDDQNFYLCAIETSDSKSLEKQLHALLSNFHYHKEWYRISQIDLLGMVKFVSNQQDQLKAHVNQVIANQSRDKVAVDIEEFVKLSKPKIDHDEGYYELDGKFFCSTCDKDYKTIGRMENHLEQGACRESKTGNYKCPKCSKAFAVKHYFDSHCKANACGPTPVLKCTECEKQYTSQKCYDKHVAGGCHRFMCGRCDKICVSQIDLQKHLNRKTPCENKHEASKPTPVKATPTNATPPQKATPSLPTVPKLIFKEGGLVKLSDIKAFIDVDAAKLLKMNSQFTVVKQNICKACLNLHKVGCCTKYQRTARTSRVYVNNVELA